MREASQQARVLVVDDNPENRALARSTLEDEGHLVVLAADGPSALSAFEAEPFDCVLLDVRMPGMDGIAVCEHIRKLPRGASVPVLFLTAQRDIDTFDRAQAAGGDDFITKPVRPGELVVRVEVALKLQRMSAELFEHYALVRNQRDELMRLQLQKDQLTAFVVHDLKNPVNTIDLHAQLLLRDSQLSDRSRDSVQKIRAEGRALLRLILNLLDISKSQEGRMTPAYEAIDLEAMLHDVRAVHEVQARNTHVAIVCVIDARTLHADADLVRRVLENLVDNAIRHAPQGSEVALRSQRVQGGVELRVADTGRGVSPELREKIFERFVQLEAGDRVINRMGRGLGLTFCKLAVEAHGGSIWIEDANPGSVFCVRFPDEPR